MRSGWLPRSVTVAIVVLAALCCVPRAQATCNNASLKGGEFGIKGVSYPTNASASGSVPFAIVGVITFDGVGGTTGELTDSRNGVVRPELPVTGSYALNLDCSGSVALSIPGRVDPLKFDLVLVSTLTEFEAVHTTPNLIMTITGKLQ